MATASYVAVLLRRRSLAYVTGSVIAALTTLPVPFVPRFEFSPCVIGGNRSLEASIFFTGWNVLRLVSVTVDIIDRPPSACKDARKTVLHALAYLLYFPGLVAGPVTNYDDFMNEAYRPPTWNRKRLLEFLARSARVVMGYCAMEGFLRFAYVRSAALTPRWFFAQSGWTLAGIVYFSSLQFYLKYNFAYGLPSLFFWLDNVYEKHDLRPRCTTRIHTAANVWRLVTAFNAARLEGVCASRLGND
nr:protein-cysteine N-palmitoyltransferase HHAT-like [Rhipicephalus microplus]